MLLLGKVVSWYSEENDDGFTFKTTMGVIVDSYNVDDEYYLVSAFIVNVDYVEIRTILATEISEFFLDEYTAKKKLGGDLDKLESLMRY
jgi:hypothetical protein